MSPDLQNATVNSLFKTDRKEWDHDIVHAILRIPLSMEREHDSWIWIKDEKGKYTVKSGYRLLCDMQGQFANDEVGFEWMKLWSLLVPPKVKNFIWRLVHNCLPTLSNLQRRKVDVINCCPVCKSSGEQLDHVLYLCSFSQKCWEQSKINVSHILGSSVGQWLASVFSLHTQREIELACTIAWNIWAHRNSVVWRNQFQTPSQVVNGASTLLFQWQKAQVKPESTSPITRSQEGRVTWQKPAPGWVTCNVDDVVYKQKNISSFGCLIKDDQGGFQAGYGGQLVGISDPKIAESMAFREALLWVKRRDCSNVLFELDSLTVVQAIRRRKGEDRSYFGALISDCATMLKDLRPSDVYFVRRSANVAAHTIAREASSMTDRREWESTPPFLIDVIRNDIQ